MTYLLETDIWAAASFGFSRRKRELVGNKQVKRSSWGVQKRAVTMVRGCGRQNSRWPHELAPGVRSLTMSQSVKLHDAVTG